MASSSAKTGSFVGPTWRTLAACRAGIRAGIVGTGFSRSSVDIISMRQPVQNCRARRPSASSRFLGFFWRRLPRFDQREQEAPLKKLEGSKGGYRHLSKRGSKVFESPENGANHRDAYTKNGAKSGVCIVRNARVNEIR